MNPNRMPPVRPTELVPVHAVARMLMWSTARVRTIDDILRPDRVADGPVPTPQIACSSSSGRWTSWTS